MLDNDFKNQLKTIFENLKANYTFEIYGSYNDSSKQELIELLTEVASCSENINLNIQDSKSLEFYLKKNNQRTGIKFRGIPNGHEFTSLLLAILNSDGKGKNFPDEFITKRIQNLEGKINLTTYVSLTCTNCPDIVQALNLMAILNPNITHEMVDGALNQEEVDALKLQGVPAVYADGKLLHVGRGDLGELLGKLENQYGTTSAIENNTETKEYDVVVVGGGPAGSAAAIYSARKGLSVAIIADRIGGQVKETVGIENLISKIKTTGEELTNDLKQHISDYSINILEHRNITQLKVINGYKILTTNSGERFSTQSLIIATGASWKRLNVSGESDYIGKGVAFCPHCDGPFYKDKHVAVIGGGNSGIEAAIDLAGICSKVTVLEFAETLRADQVLQDKLKSLKNTKIYCNIQTTEVVGDGVKVTSISIKNRETNKEESISLDGIFVQIGLTPNTNIFRDIITTNNKSEIEIDSFCRTNVPGIYAAGDVSSVPYKQIIIAMGEGAKAALTSFDDRIRGKLVI